MDAKAAEKSWSPRKAWRDATQDVYNNAGSFKSQTDYDFTFEKLEKIKGDLIKAQDSGDQKAIAAANIALNEEKAYIDDMVALRKQFSEMDKSSAMSATKTHMMVIMVMHKRLLQLGWKKIMKLLKTKKEKESL